MSRQALASIYRQKLRCSCEASRGLLSAVVELSSLIKWNIMAQEPEASAAPVALGRTVERLICRRLPFIRKLESSIKVNFDEDKTLVIRNWDCKFVVERSKIKVIWNKIVKIAFTHAYLRQKRIDLCQTEKNDLRLITHMSSYTLNQIENA